MSEGTEFKGLASSGLNSLYLDVRKNNRKHWNCQICEHYSRTECNALFEIGTPRHSGDFCVWMWF